MLLKCLYRGNDDMRTVVKRWDNSASVRIPAAVMQATHLTAELRALDNKGLIGLPKTTSKILRHSCVAVYPKSEVVAPPSIRNAPPDTNHPPAGLTPFYVPVLMRVGWCGDRTWSGRSVAESGPSSAANSAGVWYPIPLCSRS